MKLDRLIGIAMALLQNDKMTAPELARRFEVSQRTILRDIDTLCLAGIPVVTSRGGNGGLSIMEGYKISKALLSPDELQTLITGLKSVNSVSKTSNLESIMEKIVPQNAMPNLTDSVVIDLSSHYKDSLSEKIALLKEAIEKKRAVTFDYYYPKGTMRRAIEPYFVEFRWNDWYVFGFCRLRNDFRRFKLNRLWNPSITELSFSLREIPPEKAEGGYAFPEPHQVKILFDKSVNFRLIEDYGLQCYEEQEDGLHLTLNYTNKDYIFSWILGFGDKARILEPEETRAEFAAIVKNISDLYN